MDGILDSQVITSLGPTGLSILAIIICWFVWQRVTTGLEDIGARLTQNFTQVDEQMKASITTLKESAKEQVADFEEQVSVAKEDARKALSGVEACQAEHRSSARVMAEQNAAFQIKFVETHPTRTEMQAAINQVTQNMRDIMEPVRDDIKFIRGQLSEKRPLR